MKAFTLTTPDQPAALVDLPDPSAPTGATMRARVRAGTRGKLVLTVG